MRLMSWLRDLVDDWRSFGATSRALNGQMFKVIDVASHPGRVYVDRYSRAVGTSIYNNMAWWLPDGWEADCKILYDAPSFPHVDQYGLPIPVRWLFSGEAVCYECTGERDCRWCKPERERRARVMG